MLTDMYQSLIAVLINTWLLKTVHVIKSEKNLMTAMTVLWKKYQKTNSEAKKTADEDLTVNIDKKHDKKQNTFRWLMSFFRKFKLNFNTADQSWNVQNECSSLMKEF